MLPLEMPFKKGRISTTDLSVKVLEALSIAAASLAGTLVTELVTGELVTGEFVTDTEESEELVGELGTIAVTPGNADTAEEESVADALVGGAAVAIGLSLAIPLVTRVGRTVSEPVIIEPELIFLKIISNFALGNNL